MDEIPLTRISKYVFAGIIIGIIATSIAAGAIIQEDRKQFINESNNDKPVSDYEEAYYNLLENNLNEIQISEGAMFEVDSYEPLNNTIEIKQGDDRFYCQTRQITANNSLKFRCWDKRRAEKFFKE